MNLLLLLACRPAADIHDSPVDSAWVFETGTGTETDDSDAALGAFDLLVSHVEQGKALPPDQCVGRGAAIADEPLQPGHCAELLAP